MVASGGGQSPIDISGWQSSDDPTPRCRYGSAARGVQWVGPLPMILFERGSELQLGDVVYRLLQVHWHTPAEHTIDGDEFDLELHLVHQNAADELLVVGTLYRVGKADAAIQRLIDATPSTGGEAVAADGLSSTDFAPANDGFYHYSGSLTAPPFSEPVQWYLSRSVGTASQRQVEQLQAVTNGPNARPLQDRNDRSILCLDC